MYFRLKSKGKMLSADELFICQLVADTLLVDKSVANKSSNKNAFKVYFKLSAFYCVTQQGQKVGL